MRLLLDTDALIWSQQAPERLGERTRSLLKAAQRNPRWISAASALEIARLIWVGRLHLMVPFETWLATAAETLNAERLPIDEAVAIEAYRLPEPLHRDPADRLLIATARVNDCHLVTSDRLILGYRHVRTLDARR
jgi:PIN domain nuclease of toxin-antitoxin system